MFEFNPELMNEDDEEADASTIEREIDDEVKIVLHFDFNWCDVYWTAMLEVWSVLAWPLSGETWVIVKVSNGKSV